MNPISRLVSALTPKREVRHDPDVADSVKAARIQMHRSYEKIQELQAIGDELRVRRFYREQHSRHRS